MAGKYWSPEEVALVREVYPVEPNWKKLLEKFPGRTQASIRNQVISLGIRRNVNSRTRWTGVELVALRKLYPLAPWAQICAAIPRHPQPSIAKMANQIKLKRDVATKRSQFQLIRTLRSIRRKSGMPSSKLADQIGIHRVQLAKWERGEQLPRLRGLFDWVEALGCKLEVAHQSGRHA